MIDTTKFTQVLILKRHWPLAVAAGLTVISVVVPVALGMPPVYKANVKMSVERQAAANATQAQILNGLETRLLRIKNETLSRSYLEEMILRLDLYSDVRQKASLAAAVDRVQRDILISPNSTTSSSSGPATLTFTISFIGAERTKVAGVANDVANFYIAQNDLMRNSESAHTADQLERQVKEARQRFEEANANLLAYTKANASELPEQASLRMAQLNGVNADLTAKQTRLNNLKGQENNLELQIIAERNKPVPVTAAATQSLTPEQQLASANQELSSWLDKRAGENHREVIRLRALVKELESKASTATPSSRPSETALTSQLDVFQRQLAETKDEVKRLNPEINRLEADRSRLLNELRAIPTRNQTLEDLTRTAAVQREIYDGYKRSYDQAFIAAELEQKQASQEFRILDVAKTPGEPAGPNRLSVIVGGIVAAIVFGLGLAVVRDQFDTSFHTLDELRGFTQVPILASIPLIVTSKHRWRRTAVLVVGACVLLVSLAFVSVRAYGFAQRHAELTRLVTK